MSSQVFLYHTSKENPIFLNFIGTYMSIHITSVILMKLIVSYGKMVNMLILFKLKGILLFPPSFVVRKGKYPPLLTCPKFWQKYRAIPFESHDSQSPSEFHHILIFMELFVPNIQWDELRKYLLSDREICTFLLHRLVPLALA